MDLPNLRKKPTYGHLLSTLENLEVQQNLWTKSTATGQSQPTDPAAIIRFLMSIIASDLEWLQESINADGQAVSTMDQKETIFELASRRVAERCGRSAMPEMTRTWTIPASSHLPELKFDIREPPLTGDNLGLKTWGTAFVIARKLESFCNEYLSHLPNYSDAGGSTSTSLLLGTKVLELGAGTGLVGIAAGAIWGSDIFLTDLADITNNLLFNIDKNTAIVEQLGGHISGGILNWKEPDKVLDTLPCKKFDILLAADPLYDDDHPALLANVIKMFLRTDKNSRALVAVPMRDSTTKALSEKLSDLMIESGFMVEASGEEICRDDWESTDAPEVKLRWTFWKINLSSESKVE